MKDKIQTSHWAKILQITTFQIWRFCPSTCLLINIFTLVKPWRQCNNEEGFLAAGQIQCYHFQVKHGPPTLLAQVGGATTMPWSEVSRWQGPVRQGQILGDKPEWLMSGQSWMEKEPTEMIQVLENSRGMPLT